MGEELFGIGGGSRVGMRGRTLRASRTIGGRGGMEGPGVVGGRTLFGHNNCTVTVATTMVTNVVILGVLLSTLTRHVPLRCSVALRGDGSVDRRGVRCVGNVSGRIAVAIYTARRSCLDCVDCTTRRCNITSSCSSCCDRALAVVGGCSGCGHGVGVGFISARSARFAGVATGCPRRGLNCNSLVIAYGRNRARHCGIIDFRSVCTLRRGRTCTVCNACCSIANGGVRATLANTVTCMADSISGGTLFVAKRDGRSFSRDCRGLLGSGGCRISIVSSDIMARVSDSCSTVFVITPAASFVSSRLSVVSDFLSGSNGCSGNLICFTSTTSPCLRGLSTFLTR